MEELSAILPIEIKSYSTKSQIFHNKQANLKCNLNRGNSSFNKSLIVYKSSHIFSVDNQYELNKNFTLALKFIALHFFVCFDMLLSLAWLSSEDPAMI